MLFASTDFNFIFLISNEVRNLLRHLLTIQMASFVKRLFSYFAHLGKVEMSFSCMNIFPSVCICVQMQSLFSFKNFLKFYIGVQLINYVVIVSGGQQRDSAMHIHVSILPQTSFPSKLPHTIKQNSPKNIMFNEETQQTTIQSHFFMQYYSMFIN